MLILGVQFTASAFAVIVAGIFLTRCADAIADQTKLGKALVGGIFLAAATSLPELLINISAIVEGMPNLAAGDLMGASLFNLLILAIADLIHRSPKSMFSKAGGAHALAASMSINLSAIATMAIVLGPRLNRFAIGPFGAGSLALVVAYVLGLRLIYSEHKFAAFEKEKTANTASPQPQMTLRRALAGFAGATALLLVAAPFLADAAGKIADITGLGRTFVGTTLLALCTTLPELVSTITAVRMGAFDLAISNIFGSNAYNMLLFAPLDLFHEGALLGSVSPLHALTGLATITATSVAVMGQLYLVEKRRKLIEPDAFTIITIVVGFLFLLYLFKDSFA